MTLITLTTRRARKQVPGRERRDDNFSFFSPAGEVEVVCAGDDMDDFERDTRIVLLDGQMNDAARFAALVKYLSENCGLRVE